MSIMLDRTKLRGLLNNPSFSFDKLIPMALRSLRTFSWSRKSIRRVLSSSRISLISLRSSISFPIQRNWWSLRLPPSLSSFSTPSEKILKHPASPSVLWKVKMAQERGEGYLPLFQWTFHRTRGAAFSRCSSWGQGRSLSIHSQ